jgi:hypothetical protein
VKIIVYSLIGIGLSLVESAFLTFFPFEFFKPDLGLPLVLYGALFMEPAAGITVTLLVALSQEVLTAAPHGTIVFTKLALFLVTVFLKRKLFIESKYMFAFFSGLFALVESLLYLLLTVVGRGDLSNLLNVFFYTLPNAVFTGFTSIFILFLIERMNERFLEGAR